MPFNGSGTFSYTTSGTPVVTSTVISSTMFNAMLLEGATGLSTCVAKDGQTATTARIPFASGISTAAATPVIMTNGQAVSVALTSQTSGAATLTIPDFAGVADEFVFKTKAVTMSNKTFVAPALGAATATGLTFSSGSAGLALYNTADQTTNYERFVVNWNSNVALIGNETGGAGTGPRVTRIFSQGAAGNASYAALDVVRSGTTGPFIRMGFYSTETGTALSSTGVGGNFGLIEWQNASTSGSTATWAVLPTYNQTSGTAANTDLLVNRTQTAVGSGSQLLADFQVGGVSKFSVSNAGAITGASIALSSTIQTSGVGPHAFGAATSATIQYRISGAFAASAPYGLFVDSSISPAANTSATGAYIGPTLIEAGSGTHTGLIALAVQPIITAGAAATTDAVAIDVLSFDAQSATTATGLRVAAPTNGGTNRAINMTSGDIYKNGTAYTNPDFVLEHWATGKIEKFAMNEGADLYRPITLPEARTFAKEHFYLPQLDFFKAHDQQSGGFQRSDISLILHEDTFRYLWDHDDRINALEQRVTALEEKRN